ncbi:hypothetical protein QJQ45_023785, partial [Haematococcus lacustris]
DWVVANRGLSSDGMCREVALGSRDLDTFRADMLCYRSQLEQINKIPDVQVLGVLEVRLEALLASFKPSPQRCLTLITQLLPVLANQTYSQFITKIHTSTSRLQRTPSTVEEFADYLEFWAELDASKQATDKEYDHVVAHYDLMAEFGIKVPELQQAAYQTMESDYAALRDAMWTGLLRLVSWVCAAETSREGLVGRFKADLEAQVEELLREVLDIRLLAQHDSILHEHSDPLQVLAYTQELLDKVATQRAVSQRINKYQRLFKLEETKLQELDDCGEDCALRHSLWASKLQWAELTQTWLHSRLDALNAAQLEDTVQRYNKAVFKMERGLMPNKVVPKLRDSVAVWRELVPIVAALRNPHMKDRHWYKVHEVLGTLLERGERLTLQSLVDLKVVDHREELAVISNEATQEAALEAMLDKVTDKWRHVEFSVVHYKDSKDTYILGGVDEVMVVLEDSMVAVGTISASRFVAGIRHEVEKTERQLRLFSDTLDEWLECQKQWLYLETIFRCPTCF